MTVLAWGARVSPEFRKRVRDIAAEVETSPSWLMACMAFETGRTFSPSVRNPGSSATGLLQFMESTARGLGTTTEALARMTALEQLEYVLAYFKPFTGRLGTLADVYMAILWPPAVGQPDDYPVFKDKHAAYAANKGLDINHDGAITKAECTAFVDRMLAEGLEAGNRAFEPIADPEVIQPATPIEDRPQPAKPPEESRMPLPILALISAFGPMIAEMIPAVAKAFDRKSDTPQKIEAATKILDTIVTATGTANVQAAVEQMKNDPAALTAARNAVVTEPQIMGLLEIGGGIEAAKAANLEMQIAPQGFWRNPAFWITVMLMLFPTALLYDVFWGHPATYEAELRTQIVTSILGIILVVCGYWLGTSAGSVRKTDIIATQGSPK